MSSSFSYLFFVLLHLIFFVLFLSSGHARARVLPPFYEVIRNYNFFRVVWIFFVCHWLVHRFLFFGITKYQLLIISYTFFAAKMQSQRSIVLYLQTQGLHLEASIILTKICSCLFIHWPETWKKAYNFQNKCSTIKCIYTRLGNST